MTKTLCQLPSLKVKLVDTKDGGVIVQNTIEASSITEVKRQQC